MAVRAKIFLKPPLTRKLVDFGGKKRAKYIYRLIKPYLRKTDKILDFGSGSCYVSEFLKNLNYTVTPLDIENISLSPHIVPEIYDGKTIPYSKNTFDLALIVGVLHHIKDHDPIIREIARVAKKIIIIEDVYDNVFQKYITFIVDSVLNQEFWGHPHSNRNDREWKEYFQKHGLKLLDTTYSRWNAQKLMKHATYYLKK